MLISTYALCGFSNFGSIGVQLGSLGAMAPSRRKDLASVALRAMIAGNVACFMTASIAGKHATLLYVISYYFVLLCPARRVGGIDARLTFVCLSRTSGLSREQRGLGRLKLAQR